MYRLILICFIGFILAEYQSPFGKRDSGSHWGARHVVNVNQDDVSANNIAKLLIDAGGKMDQYCTANSDRPMREVYGVRHFRVSVTLQEFFARDIKVQIRQRLLMVRVENDSDVYKAVRILPDIVDTDRAVWRFKNNKLTIYFPYNVSPDTEVQSRCGRALDNNIIIVPKCDDDKQFDPDYMLSFGDDKMIQAIMDYLDKIKQRNTGAGTGTTRHCQRDAAGDCLDDNRGIETDSLELIDRHNKRAWSLELIDDD